MEAPRLFVVKKDGRREQYNRDKILSGLRRACEKRPVSDAQMEEIKTVDPVAYIRFASVYRSFRDVESFQAELADLLSK